MTLERVVIVGGGVAGLTLALALKQAGVDAEVHEKYDHLQGRTTGFTIWSYAIQQLVSIGMEEEALDRIGSEIEVTEVRLQDGTLIGEMPVGEASRDLGAPSYDLGRRDLQEQLIAAIGADSVHMGSECVGVEQGDGPATILLADGDPPPATSSSPRTGSTPSCATRWRESRGFATPGSEVGAG
jgi:2-polyprenyl-6-methoxyphenol hydroxylase-like FAD-dependent oxidoreductase